MQKVWRYSKTLSMKGKAIQLLIFNIKKTIYSKQILILGFNLKEETIFDINSDEVSITIYR